MAIDPYNWIDKVKRYYIFSKDEKLWLAISILVMGFIVGFNDNSETFDIAKWSLNLIISIIAVAIAVLVKESAHRIIGLEQGYKVTFKPFFYGLIAGVILSFMSYGKIIFLAYGTPMPNIIEKHRLGYFRYQLGYFHYGAIALMGPVLNILTAIFLQAINILPAEITSKFVMVNIILALTSMLPIPGTVGLPVLFSSRWVYLLSYGAMIGISFFLLKGFSWWIVLLGGILAAIVLWFGFYFLIEKKL